MPEFHSCITIVIRKRHRYYPRICTLGVLAPFWTCLLSFSLLVALARDRPYRFGSTFCIFNLIFHLHSSNHAENLFVGTPVKYCLKWFAVFLLICLQTLCDSLLKFYSLLYLSIASLPFPFLFWEDCAVNPKVGWPGLCARWAKLVKSSK